MDGADSRTAGKFYVVVVQSVLLFGSEMWVMNPRLDKPLEGFHNRAVRRVVGMVPKHQRYGTWVYPPIGEALTMMGMDETGVYIFPLP